jgi:hypothetical protein
MKEKEECRERDWFSVSFLKLGSTGFSFLLQAGKLWPSSLIGAGHVTCGRLAEKNCGVPFLKLELGM